MEKIFLIADSAEQISDAIAQVYQDESLWNELSKTGLTFAENAWGSEAAWSNLQKILIELNMPSVRTSRRLSLWNSGEINVTNSNSLKSERSI